MIARKPTSALWCALIALLPVTRAAAQQTPLSRAEQATSSYAFAWLLGAGIYDVDGREVQIYRLPLRRQLRADAAERAPLEVTLPITAGVYDFRLRDVLGSGLPRELSTLSVVPGLRWQRELSDAWTLRPHVEVGVARADEQDDWVAGAGLEAETVARWPNFRWRFETSLRMAIADFAGRRLDDLWLIEQGVELTGSGRRRQVSRDIDVAPYAVLRVYLDPPSAPLAAEAAGGLSRVHVEIGLTIGTVEPLRLGRLALPRVGIAWRAGEDLSLLRLVIGAPF